MQVDSMINDFCAIDDQIKALEKVREDLKSSLVKVAQTSNARELESSSGKRVRLQQAHLIKAEKLRKLVSVSMWTQITKRVPVKALIEAQVAKGNLDVSLVDSSREPGKATIVQC